MDKSVIHNNHGSSCPDAIESYGKRWQIETLFSCLKGRGFHFEDTHVTNRRRIKSLLVVLVIAFCWAHRVGEWQHENVCAIKVKKHQRLEKSIFRLGLDTISECLFKLIQKRKIQLNVLFLHLKIQHKKSLEWFLSCTELIAIRDIFKSRYCRSSHVVFLSQLKLL